ncbi:MAG: aryl-sulfate sulfotransferase [Spirochaetota bacterium]
MSCASFGPGVGSPRRLEVPSFDILEWQAAREAQIIADYRSASHDLRSLYVALDPYEMNPLSALVIFDTTEPAEVKVTVPGDTADTTVSYAVPRKTLHHEVPILGLYAGRVNHVRLEAVSEIGKVVTSVVDIATEGLPLDFQYYDLVASKPGSMEPGMTLCVACFETTYTSFLDARGSVRGYLSNRRMAHGTAIIQLKNGHLLATGDEMKQVPYNMASLWEFNWLGKIFAEYEIPTAVHHSISELPDGDILVVSNPLDMVGSGTREDCAIIFDPATGLVKREYDFRKILDDTRDPYTHFHPAILHAPNKDWMHMNAAIWDDSDKSILVSSPIQSMVVKIDAATSAIKWILGPHEGYDDASAFLQPKLLAAADSGVEWPWGQHSPVLLSSSAGKLDILMFDNGQNRSFTKEGALAPGSNWSRGVEYSIDESARTVRQVWEYGKERGTETYATFLGSVQALPITGHRLIDFGGQLKRSGLRTDDIVAGVLGEETVESRIVEVDRDGQVVFEVAAKPSPYSASAETYQAHRVGLFAGSAYDYALGERAGKRLGRSYVIPEDPTFKKAPFPIGKIGMTFNDIHRESKRLVIDGQLTWGGKSYLLSRVYIALVGKKGIHAFAAICGLNGRALASIDLGSFASGHYDIYIAGAVREGNDAASGPLHSGYAFSGYGITLP